MELYKGIFPTLILLLVFSSTSCQNKHEVNTLTPFTTGLNYPVCIAHAGDSRLFVAEQAGSIRVIDSAGNISAQPFLDIKSRVVFGGERGLLGVAFHPQYATNGYFYVNYIGEGDSSHISRFSVSADDSNKADPQSEFKLITLKQPYTNHNGGTLCFGPDGYLYIGFGDGGSGGDPGNRAQNPMVLFGKMLRIDVNYGVPYSIPSTNPFNNTSQVLPEIWATGLRNPWKFSFDRLTGDLWIADVGQNAVEEINLQLAASSGGENYGWRCYEGNEVYSDVDCVSGDALTFPVYTYPHGPECSITGGYIYRGDASSPFYGYYFFTDYCSDKIRTLHNENGNWIMEEFGQFAGNNFSTFGEDSKGQLYVAGLSSGTLFRVLGKNTTGLRENEAMSVIKIIHFPAVHKIRIENGLNNSSEIKISLFDVKGISRFNSVTRENKYEFDPGYLQDGVYFLKIGIEGRNLVRKLFISQ